MKDEKLETATLAGGCFWCTEALFKRLRGVALVTSGYAGGWKENPSYEEVSSGKTGHAEAVQITFDSKVISFEKLLELFFHLHDPTTLNQQGADLGSQYRSAIFYHSEEQKRIAEQMIKRLTKSKEFKGKIVTFLLPFSTFYQAENYHRNYYERNSDQPYCRVIINPKLQKLYQEFTGQIEGGSS